MKYTFQRMSYYLMNLLSNLLDNSCPWLYKYHPHCEKGLKLWGLQSSFGLSTAFWCYLDTGSFLINPTMNKPISTLEEVHIIEIIDKSSKEYWLSQLCNWFNLLCPGNLECMEKRRKRLLWRSNHVRNLGEQDCCCRH